MNGETPNDLLDSRDLLLDQLSVIGNITVTKRGTTGAVDVKIGNSTIVDQDGVHADIDTSSITGGSLGALVKLSDTSGESASTVQYYMDKLDTMAAAIAKSVNDLHYNALNLEGKSGAENAGAVFFVSNDGKEVNAGNITVNSAIQKDVSKIAASDEINNLTGNGDVALAIANLKMTSQMADSVDGTSKKTIGAFYQEMVTQLGSKASEAKSNAASQKILVDNLSAKRESLSGVSLDEETANMVIYQHAFSACARVISVVDEMLDTIINRMKG
jgi:flagellar hook-associated protein 1 FlgK